MQNYYQQLLNQSIQQLQGNVPNNMIQTPTQMQMSQEQALYQEFLQSPAGIKSVENTKKDYQVWYNQKMGIIEDTTLQDKVAEQDRIIAQMRDELNKLKGVKQNGNTK